ncbi:hypothetical protein XH80_12915 [Bradyrhizobium sp. CCBAU 45384]|nr:hypothetical protein [Bradyrhizobium sp. CCBAU 45384]
MPRLQYAVADLVRASSPTQASGLLDRPQKPGDDTVSAVGWAKARQRRAHDLFRSEKQAVGTLRFAHPTKLGDDQN